MVKRTYKKILTIIGDEKVTSWFIIKNFVNYFGYEPNKATIYSDLSRAVRDGVLDKDENGFYSVKLTDTNGSL